MKKRIVSLGIIFCLFVAGTGYGQVDRSEEVKVLINGLNSGSSAHRIKTAKIITQSGIVDPGLYEKLAALLKAGYADGIESNHVDEMSWLCKALASSGDPKYKALLHEVFEKAPSLKLQHYAKQSYGLIEEYAGRSKVLNSTEAWDVDLSNEENRLVNMLSSDNIGLKRDAAKTVVRNIQIHENVYDVVETELKAMLANERPNSTEIDTMAWLCKALAASGNTKYVQTLEQVRAGTDNYKLKNYASKALKQID